jgi:hypothetical protein
MQMEPFAVSAAVDVSGGCAVVGGVHAVFVTVEDVLVELLAPEPKGNRSAGRIKSPDEGGHEEELGVVAVQDLAHGKSIRGENTSGWADVLISTLGASMPYFRFNRAPMALASRAFSAAADSAKRQLIGMLGRSMPVNLILRAVSPTSGGRSFAITSLSRMPLWKTLQWKKMSQCHGWLSFASTPRGRCLVDRPTRASTLDNDADEAPGVAAGRR